MTGLPVTVFTQEIAAEYVPIEHLAIGAGLNANEVAYTGPLTIPGFPFPLAHGSQDDGNYHFNVTDLDLDARYQLYDGKFTFTPVVRGRIPVTNYENKGYAASGTHLRELGVGFYAGKYGLGLEDLVVQVSYTFTFVQKYRGDGVTPDTGPDSTDNFTVNRHDADLAISYIINDKLIAGAGVAGRYTDDGFDLANYVLLQPTDPLIKLHDPVLKAIYLAPLAFASYQFTPTWSLMARVADIVAGRSVSDALSISLTLGHSNNFLE